jgi:beta-lactamase regulating signal transducer with metallopeptidase domain
VLGAIVKATLILLLAAAAAFAVRRQSAALVHKIWMIGLVASLAIPALALVTPGLDVVPARFGDVLRGEPRAAVLGAWWLGALAGLGVMLVGTLRLAWFAVGAEPIADARWLDTLADLRRRLGVRRPVQVLVHPRVRFVGTWGVFRPRVIVPAAACEWSAQRVRAVLAHELAHVARGDWPVQVLAEAARAIYWFNPLFWFVAARLRRESEHAADNVVLELGADRVDYARELLEVSRSLDDAGRDHAPILAVTQPSFLEARLKAVLNPRLKRIAATPWATVVIILLAVAAALPLAMLERAPDRTAGSVGGGGTAVGATAATAAIEPAAGFACPVTPTVEAVPPTAEMLGSGPWHVNDDRTIWVWALPYAAESTINAVWVRPEGAQLALDGERIDGAAPRLEARVNCCSLQSFKSGGVRFPTPGCWRVTATAGDSRLTFVTEVGAAPRAPR